jgi:hypothetical protein
MVQVALTPVFLLAGIGTLLNVFNTRLSRVSDHREHVTELLRTANDIAERTGLRAHLKRLRLRTLVLDASIVLGALGGASTCGAAFVLFLECARPLPPSLCDHHAVVIGKTIKSSTTVQRRLWCRPRVHRPDALDQQRTRLLLWIRP